MPLALRDVPSMLRKSEEAQGVLHALHALEPLLLARPDELPQLAVELARALVVARPPEWADAEAEDDADRPSTQRFRCARGVVRVISSVLVGVRTVVGITVTRELLSRALQALVGKSNEAWCMQRGAGWQWAMWIQAGTKTCLLSACDLPAGDCAPPMLSLAHSPFEMTPHSLPLAAPVPAPAAEAPSRCW